MAMSLPATEAMGGHGKSARRFRLEFYGQRFSRHRCLLNIITMQMQFHLLIGRPFKFDLITLSDAQSFLALNFAMTDRDRVSQRILSPGIPKKLNRADWLDGS